MYQSYSNECCVGGNSKNEAKDCCVNETAGVGEDNLANDVVNLLRLCANHTNMSSEAGDRIGGAH